MDHLGAADQALRTAAAHAGLRLIHLPQRLSTSERVDWVTARLAEMDLPSGKLEAGETISHAAVREGREEIGIHVDEADFRFVNLTHYRNHLGDARLGVFFEVQKWKGEPYNAEPHKCSRIAWWPIGQLPDTTYPYTAEGISAYLRGQPFSKVGWAAAH